jgi:hypothetical protein
MDHNSSSSLTTMADPSLEPSLWWRRFRIRLMSWEYWPTYLFNIPVIFIWLWHSLLHRHLFFFTATNPGIHTGGFFGESKSGILRLVPDHVKPRTILWEAPVMDEEIEDLFERSGLDFPVIVKPEIGERGWLIAPIYNMAQLKAHFHHHKVSMILQPFIQSPVEVSIMVHQMPDGSSSGITSICQKEFLQVTGDGITTISDLILQQDRAVLQYEALRKKLGAMFYEIPAKGEVILLEPIGNHCRGTKFVNRNDQIDDRISEVMVGILTQMPGIFYGRFDMKIESWEGLREGIGISVMEFNGTSSDPAHIYDPGYSLIRAYKDIFRHWSIMGKIARQNRKAGIRPDPLKKIISGLILYFRYKRTN